MLILPSFDKLQGDLKQGKQGMILISADCVSERICQRSDPREVFRIANRSQRCMLLES